MFYVHLFTLHKMLLMVCYNYNQNEDFEILPGGFHYNIVYHFESGSDSLIHFYLPHYNVTLALITNPIYEHV